ncbi:protein-glucosylgalactosylhydroxylysine glucosidase-like [Tigriopus californicus]|uniref:protein-glucosylgalactosylhydroxylysine glucosidase-like n=1 Tax=Tigriopus californicus TaxID=6832 RepID=UPI0027DA30AF|nr:protein-glucosylgalactosylhydroxylysine glucosidase-like [Tigriopus californicus]
MNWPTYTCNQIAIASKRVVSEEMGYEAQLLFYAHSNYNRILVTEVHISRINGRSDEVRIPVESLGGTENILDWDWEETTSITPTKFYKTGVTKEAETDSSDTRRVHIITNYNQTLPKEFIVPEGLPIFNRIYIMSIDTSYNRAWDDFESAYNLISDPEGGAIRFGHTANWAAVWENGDIVLEGPNVNRRLHETIKSSLYYLYSNLPSDRALTQIPDRFWGLSPGGLANGANGKDYYGHVFWDMETWMYPPILMFRPDLAKEMLKYRMQGISEAQQRAAQDGYEGARFPWESAFTGAEVTPDICPLCRENQQHITGDIALAARQLISMTLDIDWLTETPYGVNITENGAQFILEMAKFWASRPTYNETKGQYEINEVMPPDEHQEHAHNSIYTNLIANYAVNTARWTECLISGSAMASQSVPDVWLERMKNLVFLFNKDKRYHEEYEGFDMEYESGTLDPRGIKQADVVLLGFPLNWDMPEDVRRNDLELYEPITNPDGPAMTWGIFATSWLELGNETKAQNLFTRSYDPYVREPFKIWTEVQSGVGAVNFITGAGGFLQALMFGYGGMRIKPYSFEFSSTFMPQDVETLKFVGLVYLGTTFDLTLENDNVDIQINKAGQVPLELTFQDGSSDSFSGTTFNFPRQDFKLAPQEKPLCDTPKDEINVIYD